MSTFAINVGGDIFADIPADMDTVTVIAHGVNTRGVMGGFAGLIDKRFPVDAAQYRAACSHAAVAPGRAFITGTDDAPEGPNLWIAHVASQREPGPDARVEWLISGLNDMYEQLANDLGNEDARRVVVRLPLIGGGIGGIDPLVAAAVIRTAAEQAYIAGDDIHTALYLLDSDPATESIVAALGGADRE